MNAIERSGAMSRRLFGQLLPISAFCAVFGHGHRCQAEPSTTLQPVMETSLFTAVPCRDCDVPGYVILIPKSSGSSLKDLSSDTQSQFGPALAKVEAAIKSVTGADRVYIMRFSEAMESVHFHLFPRTSELANAFRKELPSDEPGINGPMLFAWARKKFYVPSPTRLSPHTLEVATKISAYLKSENR